MLLLARLAALSIGIAVLMLFVLPGLVGTPETDEDADGRSDVKIARNTTWDGAATSPGETVPGGPTAPQTTSEEASSSSSTSLGEPAPAPQSDASRPGDGSGEMDRHAAIEQGRAAAAKPPVRKRFYRVIVQDAGTLKTGNHIIRLAGISVREEDETCKDENGASWPCGTRARAALTRLIRGRAVICDVPAAGDRPEITARCRIGETDLSLWMVAQGWRKE